MCAHYGWTWHYLHWGVPYGIVERMMIDAPSYESGKTKPTGQKEVTRELTDENALDVMRELENYQP